MSKEPDKICVRIHATRGLSAKIARALGTHRSPVYHWQRVSVEQGPLEAAFGDARQIGIKSRKPKL
jgi:hypothetical protein